MEPNELNLQRSNLEMFAVANEYCLFTEACHSYHLNEVLEYLQKILPLLYLKGAILPLENPDEDAINERYVTEEQYEALFNSLREIFGDKDEFVILKDEEHITLSLSELLSDIYQDMKDYVLLYQHPISSAKHQSAYNLKQLFAFHWGPSITEALKHLHTILYVKDETGSL
jgi:hypothetical protein